MRRLLLLLLILGGTVYAFAGSEEFTFVGWNQGNWENGYPYIIEPTNGPPGQFYAVMCDDYEHGGMPGDQWDANITNLGSQNITLARFDNIPTTNALGPLGLYDEAGWILLQTLNVQSDQFMEMNFAVWNIFDPSAPCNSGCEAWIQMAEQAAENHFPDTNFDRIYIITPVDQHDPDPNSIQEFLYLGNPSGFPDQSGSAPEPSTLVLMGTGLVGFVGRKFLN
jgi:hypothetical protein